MDSHRTLQKSREMLDDESVSSDSDSEEENEEDADDFHHHIEPALLIGQTLTAYWPWTAFIDKAVGEEDIKYNYENNSSDNSEMDGLHATWTEGYLEPYSPHPSLRFRDIPSPSPVHRRAPSLPSELQLDDITLTSDFEYGFNPNRVTKIGDKDRLRPSSLCDSENRTFRFSESRNSLGSILGSSDHFMRSHATNEKEAILEAEVKHLRAQPSGVQFMRRCSTDLHDSRSCSDLKKDKRIGHKRLRALRRQFSFDSNSRRKTVSDDRDIARLRGKHLRKRGDISAPLLRSRSRDDTDCQVQNSMQSNMGSVSAEVLCSSAVNIATGTQERAQGVINVAPPPLIKENLETSVFLRSGNDSESDHGKVIDSKTRRRGSIPGLFSGFRFPNKKAFKRLMRRRQERANVTTPVVPLPAPAPNESGELFMTSSRGEGTVLAKTSASLPGEVLGSQQSLNSFRRSDKDRGLRIGHPMRLLVSCAGVPLSKEFKSCSVRSLPKVEEGFEDESAETSKSLGALDENQHSTTKQRSKSRKESPQFDESFRRKSCSTCSIAVAKHLRTTSTRDDNQILRRRMSDTALTLQDRTPGCSPGRRFVRRLLSPVVCGLPVERYITFNNDSMLSLTSDSTSIASETEPLLARLFDFSLEELVEELTLIDKELLIRISWQELANCGWMSKNKFSVAPNVMNMVDFFNRIAMLIASNILAEESVYIRAKIISKVIKLARKCRTINNFNSLKAILGGLQCTPIYRLKTTWKQVSSRRKKQLKELTKLMSEIDNFRKYRFELSKCIMDDMSCLPFLGDFLTQLAQTHAYFAVRRKLMSTAHKTSLPRSDSPMPHPQDESLKSIEQKSVKSAGVSEPENDAVLSTQHCKQDELTKEERAQEKIDKNNRLLNVPVKPDSLHVKTLAPSEEAKESKRTHARSDSDDSGVVIDTHRLSRDSEDLEGSREHLNQISTSDFEQSSDGMSSPEGETRDLSVFVSKDDKIKKSLFIDTKSNLVSQTVAKRGEISAVEGEKSDLKNHGKYGADSRISRMEDGEDKGILPSGANDDARKSHMGSCSSDKCLDLVRTNSKGDCDEHQCLLEDCDETSQDDDVINDRKILDHGDQYSSEEFAKQTKELEERLRKRRLPPMDEKYQKELEFWKYQIVTIQYRFPPRPHVRKFLLNTNYNSEEENYRLSLAREPPEKST